MNQIAWVNRFYPNLKIKDLIKVFVSICFAAVLLYLVFRNVEWQAFLEKAKSVDYSWVLASILLSLVAYAARAYRWNILLQPLGYDLRTERTLLAVLVGYLANLALPRVGEVVRCGLLKKNEDVPVSVGFGSVVLERVVDMMTLLLCFFLSLVIEFDLLVGFLVDAYAGLALSPYFLIGFGFFAVIGLVLGIFFIRYQLRREGKIAALFAEFVKGLTSVRRINKPTGFFISTIILWVVYYLMSYIIIYSIPETSHLGFGVGLTLLVVGGIALAIPVQSGFGTYHGMIAGLLVLYGVDATTGIFLATLLHTSQIVAIAIFGSIALLISLVIQKRKVNVGG